MKKQYNSITASIALALLMSACSDSEIVVVPSAETSAQVVRAIASADDTTTRVAVDDDGSFINFLWEDNDSFVVINGTQATEFTLVDGAGDKGATFEGKPDVPYTDGETLYAVFNKKANADNNYCLDENGNMRLELNPQDGTLSGDQTFLYAEGQYSAATGTVSFNFNSLTSIVKVELDLPSGVSTLDSLSFDFGNNDMTKATLVLGSPISWSYNNYQAGSLVNMPKIYVDNHHVIRNVSVEDNKVVAYFYMFAIDILFEYSSGDYYEQGIESSYGSPLIMAYSGNRQYYMKKASQSRSISKGRTYKLASSLFEPAEFDNEQITDGRSEPYQISTAAQLYTLMYKTKMQMHNNYNYDYRELDYVLVNDIELNENIDWSGIMLINGTFDGQGHTISGNIDFGTSRPDNYLGLFSSVYSSTIKNLKLTASISSKNTSFRQGYAGSIVGNLSSSTIENCSSSSDILFMTNRLGGLVGYASGSRIVGSSFTGTIKHDFDYNSGYIYTYSSIGGIVGYIQNYTSVIGCYCNGSAFVETGRRIRSTAYSRGGIVGLVSDPADSWGSEGLNIIGCYASLPIVIDELDTDYTLYSGGISGYGISGTMTNCYWDYNVATYATSDTNMSQNNCATYTGDHPTAEQIAAMNAAIAGCGYKYDENGMLKVDTSTTIDPFEKVEW